MERCGRPTYRISIWTDSEGKDILMHWCAPHHRTDVLKQNPIEEMDSLPIEEVEKWTRPYVKATHILVIT